MDSTLLLIVEGGIPQHLREQLLSMIQYLHYEQSLNATPLVMTDQSMLPIYRTGYSNTDLHGRTHLVVLGEVHYSNPAVAVAEVHCIDLELVEVVR